MKIKLLKKLTNFVILILCLFLLEGCHGDYDLKDTIWVTSIGIDYNNTTQKYTFYGYAPNTNSVSNVQSNETTRYFLYKAETNLLFDGFVELDKSTIMHLDLKYLKTMILTESFLIDKNKILNLFYLCMGTNGIPLDITFFYAESKIEEIYQSALPDIKNVAYDLFTTPSVYSYFDPPISMLKMGELADYILHNFSIKLPGLSIEESWSDEKQTMKTVNICGFYYLDYDEKKYKYFDSKEEQICNLLKSHSDFYIKNENFEFVIKDWKLSKKIKNQELYLKVSYRYQEVFGKDSSPKNVIEEGLYQILEYYEKNLYDLLDIDRLLYRNNKKSVDKIKVVVMEIK